MKLACTTMLALGLACCAHAETGRARADLVLESPSYQPGKPVHALIRITYDKGWHGYWVNPGEGGMKTAVVWKLPDAWKAGETGFPVPVRSTVGGLATYGYEGEVLLPVTLDAPDSATGAAVLEAKVSWLACDEGACVPGEAVLRATIEAGPPRDGPDAAIVRKAREALPAPVPGLSLAITESGRIVRMTISGNALPDLDGAEVFPITGQALSPAVPILLSKDGAGFSATAGRSEYATGPLRELRVVIHGSRLQRPILAGWAGNRQ